MIAQSKIESVPFIFRMPDNNLYPSDNWPDAEYWFSENIKSDEINGDRIYLRVLWTSFYKNNCNYGNDKNSIKILQDWLNILDSSKKYFTIIGWDDGILNEISHLDIKVFSMAGGRKDYGLPLICQPHKLKFDNIRNIFASFVGRITNPVREEIVNLYSKKPDYLITTKSHSLPDYCRVLSKSIFGLCAQGYGFNSFRIQECLEYGAIPVWISSEFLPIHNLNFEDFGVLIESKEVDKIDKILKVFSEKEIKDMQENGKYVFENYFTFESNKRLILENI